MSYQPPVTPGYPTTPPQGDWTPPKPARSRRPWLIGAAVVLVLAIAGLSYVLLVGGGSLAPAVEKCGASRDGLTLADDDQTLIIDTRAQSEEAPGASIETVACILGELRAPEAVAQHIDTTRALDGQQTDSWSGYKARWTYHPSTGLHLTLQVD